MRTLAFTVRRGQGSGEPAAEGDRLSLDTSGEKPQSENEGRNRDCLAIADEV